MKVGGLRACDPAWRQSLEAQLISELGAETSQQDQATFKALSPQTVEAFKAPNLEVTGHPGFMLRPVSVTFFRPDASLTCGMDGVVSCQGLWNKTWPSWELGSRRAGALVGFRPGCNKASLGDSGFGIFRTAGAFGTTAEER